MTDDTMIGSSIFSDAISCSRGNTAVPPCGLRSLRLLNLFGESFENRGATMRTRPKMGGHFRGVADRMSDENQKKLTPALGPAVMRTIGCELRAMYADIIGEGVPERFIAILRRLGDPEPRGLDMRVLDREGRRRSMSAYIVIVSEDDRT